MQLFALSLPIGKLSPGFLFPIFSGNGQFWIQCPLADVEEPRAQQIDLSSEDVGPILQIQALRQAIPVKLVVVGDIEKLALSAFIDAFFDGIDIVVGPRTQVTAYLTGV